MTPSFSSRYFPSASTPEFFLKGITNQEALRQTIHPFHWKNLFLRGGRRPQSQRTSQHRIFFGIPACIICKSGTSSFNSNTPPSQYHPSIGHHISMRLTHTTCHQLPHLDHLLLPPEPRVILPRGHGHGASPVPTQGLPIIHQQAPLQFRHCPQ